MAFQPVESTSLSKFWFQMWLNLVCPYDADAGAAGAEEASAAETAGAR